jgi:hypothetical protein
MFFLNKFKKKFFFKNHDLNTILYLVTAFLSITFIYDYLYFSVEKMDSILTMIYYNIVTASTVGYGDFSPQTSMGKVLTAVYIPVAISLFAAFLSMIGSLIYKRLHRRDQGEAHISHDVDYVIIGGYKEKVEELLVALIAQEKHVILINKLYDTLPLHYKQEGVLWIKGDAVSSKVLKMIDHLRVEQYVVLSSQPTEASSDMLTIYTIEKLFLHAQDKPIIAEVVKRSPIYPQASNIRYISVAKASLIAQELLQHSCLLPLEKLLENEEDINQYNLLNHSCLTWKELKESYQEQDIAAIGYWCEEKKLWSFFPDENANIEAGSKIKVIASSKNTHLPKATIEQKILLVGKRSERMEQLKREYLLDPRYKENSFKTVESLGTEMLNMQWGTTYTHVVLFADLENRQSDMVNYFYWRYFKEQFPEAKLIVELLSNDNRLELENKYEDEQSEFVSIAQIGLMVQELQDHGMIQLVEGLNEEDLQHIVKEMEQLSLPKG